jgi:hypothetical protein
MFIRRSSALHESGQDGWRMNTETIMKRLGIALGATVVLMALSGCATDGYYGAGYGYNGGYGYNRGNGYNGGYGYGYGQS